MKSKKLMSKINVYKKLDAKRNKIIKCYFCCKKAKYYPTVFNFWGSWSIFSKYTCVRCTKKVNRFLEVYGQQKRVIK